MIMATASTGNLDYDDNICDSIVSIFEYALTAVACFCFSCVDCVYFGCWY